MQKPAFLIIFFLLLTYVFGQTKIDSLENRLTDTEGKEKFEILYELARLKSQTNPDKSLSYAKASYILADSLHNDSLIISSLNALAIINFYLGENFKGLEYLNMMTIKLEQMIIDNPGSYYFKERIATAYNNEATILSDIGERNEAIDKLFRCEKYVSELIQDSPDDKSLIGFKIDIYNNLGLLFYKTGNPDKGFEFLEIALELSEQSEMTDKIALSLNNTGLLNVSQNQLTEALKNYKRALEINLLSRDSITISGNLHNLGWVYEKQMKYDSALYYYNNSLDISRRLKYQYGISNTLCNMGYIQTKLANLSLAEKTLDEALVIAVNSNIMELQEKAYKNLYELFQKKGDYKLANEYQDKYHQTTDSLYNLKSSNQLAYWQTRYETEKKEMENLALRKDNEIQQINITRKNNQVLLLIIASATLLVFVVIILVMYRQKDRAYRNIVRKNLEIVKTESVIQEKYEDGNLFPYIPQHVYKDESIINPEKEILIKKLNKFMVKEKPYLFSNISLDEICKNINTNRSYLSNLINEIYQMNFNAFINEFRIREARRFLSDKKYNHFSIEGIGEMVGFSSKSTFFKNFKKLIGVTPSYYRPSVH